MVCTAPAKNCPAVSPATPHPWAGSVVVLGVILVNLDLVNLDDLDSLLRLHGVLPHEVSAAGTAATAAFPDGGNSLRMFGTARSDSAAQRAPKRGRPVGGNMAPA